MSHSTSITARGAAAFAAALTVTGVTGAAHAQQRQQQQQQPNQGPVQGLYTVSVGSNRYTTPDGGVRFVFDRSGGSAAFVRFENDPEVHVLLPFMAAGGGDIYRNEDGSVMLRVTPQGAVTVYTRAIRTGAPVSEEGQAPRLMPQAITVGELETRFRRIALSASRSTGQNVTFTIPARMNSMAAGLVVDAAERVAVGLANAPMSNISRVVISIGRQPVVTMRADTLFVQVAPEMGYAGRPSSNTVRNVVTGAVQGPQQ